MELVTSLSTESFILALRRFISRRGRPFTIYSDNGKNLVGTSNELKNIDWKKVKDYGSLKKINWKLNPPSSPWWGVLGTAYRNAKNYSQKSPRKSLPNLRRTLYCSQLKSFSKSRKEDVIKEGDIVLIGDTNSKRIYWPLAKVIKLIPGRDGRVRVVEVLTSSGSFLRPIQRLYPLEVSGTDISDLPEQIKETLKDRV
ncbi:integrase catalytic domain-containing protein [Trichonephila clavipes]|nr:integrase catalytic domain-containing protein [Trichonephila clavipes]